MSASFEGTRPHSGTRRTGRTGMVSACSTQFPRSISLRLPPHPGVAERHALPHGGASRKPLPGPQNGMYSRMTRHSDPAPPHPQRKSVLCTRRLLARTPREEPPWISPSHRVLSTSGKALSISPGRSRCTRTSTRPTTAWATWASWRTTWSHRRTRRPTSPSANAVVAADRGADRSGCAPRTLSAKSAVQAGTRGPSGLLPSSSTTGEAITAYDALIERPVRSARLPSRAGARPEPCATT
jgi:hypothetical protein